MARPLTGWKKSAMYSIRPDFTQLPSSGTTHRGTVAGIAEKIPYLRATCTVQSRSGVVLMSKT